MVNVAANEPFIYENIIISTLLLFWFIKMYSSSLLFDPINQALFTSYCLSSL